MKLGIMQPYFYPYLGYWQLLNAVEKYVVYDDVNYIKGGWVNRNRILVNNQPHFINIPLLGASPNKLINEINVNHDERLIKKTLKTIESNYKKAPFFDNVYQIVKESLYYSEQNLAKYLFVVIEKICNYLQIETKLIMSSTIDKNNSLRGQDKVIEICRCLEADQYINAVGGTKLYDFSTFKNNGIRLLFLKSNEIVYRQFDDKSFQPGLSILDVMMFNSVEEIQNMLTKYTLIDNLNQI